jgi:hypothetical protein
MSAQFHDPYVAVSSFRRHLGDDDGPLVFLIGAGASAAAKGTDKEPLVPAVARLGERCRDAVEKRDAALLAAYDVVHAECDTALPRDANVEDVLSSVRTKISAMGEDDVLAGASREALSQIEETIRQTIAAAALPDESRIPAELPHRAFARWVAGLDRPKPLEIFTTNYDTLIERALELEHVPVFDGFVGSRTPYFSAPSLSHLPNMPGPAATRLWKMHGSVNWSRAEFGSGSGGNPPPTRIVRGQETSAGELIFPSLHKYDESRRQPYVAMLDHLTRVLERRGCVLVTLGYSFGDAHINELIFDAVEERDDVHAIALMYGDPPEDDQLIIRAQRCRNLIVYGREYAVTGRARGKWQLGEPVSKSTAPFMDVAFDSDALIGDDPGPAATGEFRLGDFDRFSKFLDYISGNG